MGHGAWAARGIAVVHLEHPGSDASVYAGAADAADLKARVRAAATGAQLQARVGDVSFILDELARRPREGGCDLSRLDLSRIGFAGHSMGAWTAQAVAGQRYFGAAAFRDPRITAAIALSPSTLTTGGLGEAFGGITIPFLSVTGSADGMPKLVRDAVPTTAQIEQQAQRTGPYTGMAPGRKYLIVFQDGDHMVFAGNLRRAAGGAGQPYPDGDGAADDGVLGDDAVRRHGGCGAAGVGGDAAAGGGGSVRGEVAGKRRRSKRRAILLPRR